WLPSGPAVSLVTRAALLVYGALYSSQPKDHPLLELLRNEGSARAVSVLILAESIVAAPIREEVLFRGILQPWLCRHPQGGTLGFAWAVLVGVLTRSLVVADAGIARFVSLAGPVLLVAAVVPVAQRVGTLLGRPDPPARLRWFAP